MAKAFKLNYSTPTNNNQRISSNLHNRQIAQPDHNKQLSKEKSTVSFLLEEKKRLNSDFKTREDEFLDKQIQHEKKIKELNNILVKTETLQLAQETREKMKQLNKEIKLENSTKINHLSRVFTVQVAKSREELYFSNVSKMANVSKSISIPNEEFSDDTTPSIERKFLNEETEYAKLWNYWYKKCDECKYDKTSYDKAYKDMQQKIERLQTQLGDLKGKCKDTSYVSDTRNPLSQKLDNENVELEFQDTSANTKFAKQPIVENLPKIGKTNALSIPVTSNSVSTSQEPKSVNNDKVIAPGMEEKQVPNTVSASSRTKLIIVSQPPIITKKNVNFDVHGLSSTGVDNSKTRRPLPRSNTKNDRVPSVSKSKLVALSGDNACNSNTMEPKIKWFPNSTSLLGRLSRFVYGTVRFGNDHVTAILGFGDLQINPFKTSREEKHVPNNVSASARTKPITVSQPSVITKKEMNYDSNGFSSTGIDNTKTRRPQHRSNTKNDRVPSTSNSSQNKNKRAEVEEHHRNLLLSKNTKHMSSACNNIKLDSQNVISKVVCAMYSGYSKHMTGNLKLLINFVWMFLGTVRFGSDHVAAIMGFGDLQWGNILITRVNSLKDWVITCSR
nr:integrase, catalytic region, zinc finger, CCHC-type, peptidase aspartic, catalytic [Tanacetum cinerariifolium]